jgi:hypothetical protein
MAIYIYDGAKLAAAQQARLATARYDAWRGWMEWTQTFTLLLPAGLQEVYLAIMDAVDRVQPGAALFILQGPQQQGTAASSQDKWGNGFTADPYLISQGLSGANSSRGVGAARLSVPLYSCQLQKLACEASLLKY